MTGLLPLHTHTPACAPPRSPLSPRHPGPPIDVGERTHLLELLHASLEEDIAVSGARMTYPDFCHWYRAAWHAVLSARRDVEAHTDVWPVFQESPRTASRRARRLARAAVAARSCTTPTATQ